jgi:aldehyde dehydrogenase (NAD+)
MKFNDADVLSELGLSELNSGAYCSDGDWSSINDKNSYAAIDPSSEKQIARVSSATKEDYHRIISCAVDAQRKWRTVPAPLRGQLITRIGELVAKHHSALGAIVAIDTGKSLMEGKAEVKEVIDMAILAAGQSRMLYGFTQQSQRAQHRMYDQWLPLGVAAVISAYNFPAAVWAQNGFLSAICGNTVIWKPSPKVPLTAIALQHITNQAMQECGHEGVFSLFLPEDNMIADLLVVDPQVALVSFTGSSQVGAHVANVTSNTLGRRCLLECSGNNGCIVDETADLKQAARSLSFGVVGTTGQRCTSTRRVIAHSSISKQLVSYLSRSFAQIKIGDPREEDTIVGPLIDPASINQFELAVQNAQSLGGKVVYGGKRIERPGFFVEPTIIVDCKPDWPCVREETFAPIVYVIDYKDLDEAIEIQNAVPQGLASGIHSTHLSHIEQFLSTEGSDCGIAKVNMGTTGADVGAAFGGEKGTGGGRTAGSDAWKGYMRRQSVCINWSNTTPWDTLINLDDE